MRIFLDANILVSVLNKEYPLFTCTSRILSLADKYGFHVYTSPVCLAIAYYFAEKKSGSQLAKQKIALLNQHVKVADTTAACVQQTIDNKSVTDFEDGLEYYSAVAVNCKCIITEDIYDYYFSEVEVLNSNNFFLKYMSKKK